MTDQYKTNELNREHAFMQSRQKLGVWREEECPSVEGSVNRISWILNGSYGAGAQYYAEQIIANNTEGKKGKMLDKAWLAVGRELTLLTALHDTTEYTIRKITECWKKQGIDFVTMNAKAADEVKQFIANKE